MALSFRSTSSLAQQRPSAARTAAVTYRPVRASNVAVKAAVEQATLVASRRAALAMGVCGALLGAAPAWSKEQKMPADDMPAGAATTAKPTLRPDVMQQTAAAGTPPLVYVRGGGKGGSQ